MDAYRCDGCEQYFQGDPRFVIYNHGPQEFGTSPSFDACSWECVRTIADRRIKQEQR